MIWNDWKKGVFAAAKKQKKPILLSISAKWCHWCHTMDRLAYVNHDVVDFIENHFVPVRVDTDQRPDINERYNVGGWPSTLVLAFDGEPVSAATYVAPEHMVSFLEDALRRFGSYKSVKTHKQKRLVVDVAQDEFYGLIKSFFDPVNGGFGLEPKFPHHDILEYVSWRSIQLHDVHAKSMLDRTLLAMMHGEFFDSVGGGFFRYATLQNWTIPHFEKMLEDNARLLEAYVRGYQLFKRQEYLTVVNKTLFFLFTMLYDKESGLFFASQDADEEYCSLPIERRLKARGPFVDRTFFTDWNAAMAIALMTVGEIEEEYVPIGLRVLESLYEKVIRGGVAHSVTVETPAYFLKDAVYLLLALVHAFKVTNKLEWKAKALTVLKYVEKFYDKKQGGFYDILASKDSFGRLKERKMPVHENACLALVLKSLAEITKEKKYLVMAQKSLDAVSQDALALGAYAATYALAVLQSRRLN